MPRIAVKRCVMRGTHGFGNSLDLSILFLKSMRKMEDMPIADGMDAENRHCNRRCGAPISCGETCFSERLRNVLKDRGLTRLEGERNGS